MFSVTEILYLANEVCEGYVFTPVCQWTYLFLRNFHLARWHLCSVEFFNEVNFDGCIASCVLVSMRWKFPFLRQKQVCPVILFTGGGVSRPRPGGGSAQGGIQIQAQAWGGFQAQGGCGYPSMHWDRQLPAPPPGRRLLLRTVRILLEPAASCGRDQDATTVSATHIGEAGSLNWAQFMLQWFVRFPEFNESSI